ncbi:MAG: glycosyltransferase [Candidatus Aenigmarchaeota archaeon]|nr:glycosyltransferase [Candidatus Aenigmarchaeota archaeon]
MPVSIIIPTKNEPSIQELVDEIGREIEQKHEIIIIDKSEKKPRVKGASVYAQKSDGLGNAVLEGLKVSMGNPIVIMDGDGSHDPKDLAKMLEKAKDFEIVMGSKFVPGGKAHYSFSRLLISKVFNTLARIILGINVRDSMSGFAVIRRGVFERIELRPRGFKIVLETLYKSKANVFEYPITFRERMGGESKVGFNLRGLKEAWRILSLLVNLRMGRY